MEAKNLLLGDKTLLSDQQFGLRASRSTSHLLMLLSRDRIPRITALTLLSSLTT